MKKWILILAFILAGCSSSESLETKTYLLPSSTSNSELMFKAVKVEMPSYLQGPGIVYRTSEAEIIVANHNIWAENLKVMVKNRVEQHQLSQTQDAPVLNIEFERFNGSYTGNAELKGSWTLGDKYGDFNIEEPISEDGYPALVTALAKGLDKLLDEIGQK